MLAQHAQAQEVWTFAPSLRVAAVHDDNIFLSDPAIDDRITRYTPGITAGYTGEAFNFAALYTQDAEYYEDNDQLDSSSVRRTGTVALSYRATQRLTWGLNGSYFKTPLPGELNLGTLPGTPGTAPAIPGVPGTLPPGTLPGSPGSSLGGTGTGLLNLGRTPTTRYSVGGNIAYAWSPTLDSNFSYTGTQDESDIGVGAGGGIGVGGDTHEGRFEFQKELSATNAALFGYTYRQFNYNNTPQQDSHTAFIGWDHQFSARTNFRILGGPRFFGDDVEPFVEAALEHEYDTGTVRATYTRSETLLAGSATRVESQIANLVFTKRVGNNFAFSILPAWGRVESLGGTVATVFQFGADATYSFTDYISISASWQTSEQEEDSPSGASREVPRDVALVSLNFTYPIRRERP